MILTLADFKTRAGMGGTDQDVFLTAQLQLVSDAVEAYCRRRFERAKYRETFYCDAYQISSRMRTYHYPVISVDSITQDSNLFDPTTYRLHKESGTLFRAEGFFWGDNLELVYEAGYDAIPTPVVNTVFEIVNERLNKKISGVDLSFGSDVQRVSIPGAISIDYDYSLANNDRKTPFGIILGGHLNILDYYRSDRAVLPSHKIQFVEVEP